MDIIKIYFKDGSSKEIATSSWYHKPSILESIAFYFWRKFYFADDDRTKVVFVTSSKYGCRQFQPKMSVKYPVHDYMESCYKENLPWYVFEFNDLSLKYGTSDYIEDIKLRTVPKKHVLAELPF